MPHRTGQQLLIDVYGRPGVGERVLKLRAVTLHRNRSPFLNAPIKLG